MIDFKESVIKQYQKIKNWICYYFFSPVDNQENASKPLIQKNAHWGAIVVALFVVGFIAWGFFSSIESAALAPGKIVVAGNRRVVQHLEGGIISAINVKNGETVQKGQVLLKMDDAQTAVKFQSEQGQVLRLMANEARLIALISDQDKIVFPDAVRNKLNNAELKNFVDNQVASFQAERATTMANLQILKQRLLQLHEQIKGVDAQLDSSIAQLGLVKEELTALLKLEKEELVDRSRVLSMAREEQRLLGTRGEYQASIANLKQKVGETELQIIAERDKLNKNWNEELRDVREKLAQASDREKSAADIYARSNVVAPIDGVVLNLNVFTVGGVVKPGEILLEIVPKNEELVVEAKVSPQDIDVVHEGLKAKVQFSTLKTRTTPTLMGDVTYVAADVTNDEHTQKSFYIARIHIDKNELAKLRGKSPYPGMPVEVMIITNKMSPWNYFMDPIKRSFQRAFREKV